MLYQNKEKVKQILLTKTNYAVLMDFDKTMTTVDSDDSWTIIQNPKFLHPNLSLRSNKLAEKYCPIEMDYTIPPEEKYAHMVDWYAQVLDLYYQYGLTQDILISCVKCGHLTLRSGVKDFLFTLYKNHVPVIILSAGIGNVIEEVLNLHGCFYDNIHIISNFFTFQNNTMLPFCNPIIHTCNKTISTLPPTLTKILNQKNYFLLFGDFIEDIYMVPKKDLRKTLSFGFLEKNVKENLTPYRNAFDIVLTDNTSFYEVQDILHSLTENEDSKNI